MSKYTDTQLKAMAEETLCAYNLGDNRAEMLMIIMSQVTQTHPQHIVVELNKLCDVVI